VNQSEQFHTDILMVRTRAPRAKSDSYSRLHVAARALEKPLESSLLRAMIDGESA
jgi:hypothetical protein